MAHPWRTARSPRSSSTPRLSDSDTAFPVRGRLGPRGHLLHLGHPTPPSLCGDHWGPEVIYTWAALPSPSLHGDSRSPRPSSAAGAPHVVPGPVFPRGHLSSPRHLSQHQEGVALRSPPRVRLLDQGSRGGGQVSGQALWRQSLRTGDRAVLAWARAHRPAAQGACPRRLTAVRGVPMFLHCTLQCICDSHFSARSQPGGTAPRAVGSRPCIPLVPVRLLGH